jgi:hypothetical protein
MAAMTSRANQMMDNTIEVNIGRRIVAKHCHAINIAIFVAPCFVLPAHRSLLCIVRNNNGLRHSALLFLMKTGTIAS